ncbi:hypothetical protein EHS25_009171 [Saitozyma podzolica]|uniref:DUF6534 domain-containing protein n=1 Tax=Saitozyma podzolica TaxID=1890683 RepID=A0A427YL86_9TREE|nr:hypothetical protein EHS25_009171 [Saitozyma podzolica]
MSSSAASSAMANPVEAEAEMIFGSNLGYWLGPIILGLFFDAILCGVMIMQFSHWMSFSKNERMFAKVIVITSSILSLAATGYAVALCMHYFVYGFGVFSNFLSTAWNGWFLLPDAIVSVLVQVFFAERAYRLTNNNKVVVIVVGALIMLDFAGCLGCLILFNLLANGQAESNNLTIVLYTWIGGQLAADLTITGIIMWKLITSKTGWSGTDQVIKRLLRLAVETQLPPNLLALGVVITSIINPHSFLTTMFMMILSKFYVCGLLGALNSRYQLRRDMVSQPSHKGAFSKGDRPFTQPTIHVATETYVSPSGPVRPVGLNRQSRYDDIEEQDEGEGKYAYELSEVDRSSARKFDYADNESTTVLTA